MSKKSRLQKLEAQNGLAERVTIVVDWGGPTVTFNGQELSRAEFDALVISEKWLVINVTDDPEEPQK